MSGALAGAPPIATWNDLALTDHHRAELVKSGISPVVALERGYRTVTMIRDVKRLGFAESQCQVPGLLLPIRTIGSEIALYQFKPDVPRVKDGKPCKYESPPKSASQLDVPPRARPWILDPREPLVFTEGVKKGDSGASHEIACLSVTGVWNWRSGDVIATLDQIDVKGRTVYLAFDSDSQRNAQVRLAKRRLAAVLRQRGAIVYDILLPEPIPGIKVGLDDYLANGGSRISLFRLEMVELTDDDDAHHEVATGPYISTPVGIVYRKPTPNGPVEQLLTNFTAEIVEEVIADDGAGERADLAIEGRLADGTPLPRLRVPTRRYPSLDWVYEWGTRPRIGAGMGIKDRAREAIQYLSPNPARRYVFEHSGWRVIDGYGWVSLHAGGAIGAAGAITDVDVALRGAAARIGFPDPPCGEALCEAVRASLSLAELAPDPITMSLLGAVYRAPLCAPLPADLSVFLIGPTGVFKSELAALGMQHFGMAFDRLHLPANWSATANFLERSAFYFKDTLLVIDDFAPHGTQTDVARLHATADRVLRGIGNRGGRGRMHADGSLRADYPPRGLVMGTGEDAPRGQSLRARMAILDVAPGDICRERLTRAQETGRRGVFVGAMGGFLQWLAPQIDALCVRLPELLADFRARAYQGTAHARTPEAVAHLAIGWWAFLQFAEAVGALTRSEAQDVFDRAWRALGETGARQASHQAGEEPAQRFLDLLGSALSGGYAHVASVHGGPPSPPQAWGWREVTVGVGEHQRTDWHPQGGRAGWLDDDDLYIELEAALTAAQRVAQATGNGVSVSVRTLAKRLHERGFLRSTDLAARGELQIRRMLEGRRRRTLHLSASTLTLAEPAQSAQSAHDEPESAQPRGSEALDGRNPWADNPPTEELPAHTTRPPTAESRHDGRDGRIGRVFSSGTPPGDTNAPAAPAGCPTPDRCGRPGDAGCAVYQRTGRCGFAVNAGEARSQAMPPEARP